MKTNIRFNRNKRIVLNGIFMLLFLFFLHFSLYTNVSSDDVVVKIVALSLATVSLLMVLYIGGHIYDIMNERRYKTK